MFDVGVFQAPSVSMDFSSESHSQRISVEYGNSEIALELDQNRNEVDFERGESSARESSAPKWRVSGRRWPSGLEDGATLHNGACDVPGDDAFH